MFIAYNLYYITEWSYIITDIVYATKLIIYLVSFSWIVKSVSIASRSQSYNTSVQFLWLQSNFGKIPIHIALITSCLYL